MWDRTGVVNVWDRTSVVDMWEMYFPSFSTVQ